MSESVASQFTTLKQMGIDWKHAQVRITSPDPHYELKKHQRLAAD